MTRAADGARSPLGAGRLPARGAAWVVAAVALGIWAGAASGPGARGATPVGSAPCALSAQRDARLVQPDGATEPLAVVTTTVSTRCEPEARALNLVLLVDASPQTAGQTLQVLQAVLEPAVRRLGLEGRPDLHVGVISYAADARIEGPLARSTERVAAAIRNIRTRTGSCLSCGLAESVRMLRAARGGRDAAALRDVVLLASAGADVGCEAVRTTAIEARAYGIVVVTTCQGSHRDCGCMSDAAAQSRYVLQLATWEALEDRLLDLVDSRGLFHPIDEVVLEEALAPGFAYLDGGAPSGGIGNRLSWAFAPWSAEAVTVTFRARPTACGLQPLAEADGSHATARFNPSFQGVADAVADVPNAILDVPCAAPTTPPTAVPTPGPTRTARPEPTPTPRAATPQPSATPSRREDRLFLPAALSGTCLRGAARDWLLVVDASHSMYVTEVPGAGNAWELAHALALAVAGTLRPGVDRIGALAFGDAVVPDGLVEVPIAPCCAPELLDALRAGWRLDGSRADRAIDRARAMLGAGPSPRTILLLTDGDLNQTPLGGLGAALARTRAAGIDLDVVAFGADPDPRLVEAVAASGGRVLGPGERPRAAMLGALSLEIACR